MTATLTPAPTTLAQLKRALTVGTRLRCTENYRSLDIGLTHTVELVSASRVGFDDRSCHWFGKAGHYTFDGRGGWRVDVGSGHYWAYELVPADETPDQAYARELELARIRRSKLTAEAALWTAAHAGAIADVIAAGTAAADELATLPDTDAAEAVVIAIGCRTFTLAAHCPTGEDLDAPTTVPFGRRTPEAGALITHPDVQTAIVRAVEAALERHHGGTWQARPFTTPTAAHPTTRYYTLTRVQDAARTTP